MREVKDFSSQSFSSDTLQGKSSELKPDEDVKSHQVK